MTKKIKVGILRESKNPPDRRVPVTPAQAVEIKQKYPHVEIFVQPSDLRCYKNEEYRYLDIPLKEDLSHCDILLGVKEVAIDMLIPGKTYMFFAHVAKKQPHNQKLMHAILEKKIRLVDYEYLTDDKGVRVVAFGRWAGIVGAYNGLRAKGIRYDRFQIKPAHECHDMEEMYAGLKLIKLRPIKILITGGGRVAHGAMETFRVLNLRQVNPDEYLHETFNEPVFCQIDPDSYVARNDGQKFDYPHFFANPDQYHSVFKPYTKVTDLLISCHYWDPRSPVLFTKQDMQEPDFKIKIVADVTCDINGSIPSTIRSSSIADPFYGYHPFKDKEVRPDDPEAITVMAVDNLPGELPRDASSDFGKALIENVYDHLFGDLSDPMITRASITAHGKLTEKFGYLADYAKGK